MMDRESTSTARKNLGVILATGIASGIPLSLSGATLHAWLFESGYSLASIGYASLLGLPYILKFLWAPLFDIPRVRARVSRRFQVVLASLATAAFLMIVSLFEPSSRAFFPALFLVVFASATLDVLVDALRVELVHGEEAGPAVSAGVLGYRLGMILSGAGGLFLADTVGFAQAYQGLGVLLLLFGCSALLVSPSDQFVQGALPRLTLATLAAPFWDLLGRKGIPSVLIFLVLYKAGDLLAGGMTVPFLQSLGISKTEIGIAVKTGGVIALIVGSLVAGAFLSRIGLRTALLTFGVLQMLSTGGYLLLVQIPAPILLYPIVAFEYFCAGLGTAALLVFLMALSNRQYSASQYALLSGMNAFARLGFEFLSGRLAEGVGWFGFYSISVVLAAPALVMAWFCFSRWVEAGVFQTPLESSDTRS